MLPTAWGAPQLPEPDQRAVCNRDTSFFPLYLQVTWGYSLHQRRGWASPFTPCYPVRICTAWIVWGSTFGCDVGCWSLSVGKASTVVCLSGTDREWNRNFDTECQGGWLVLEWLPPTISAVKETMGENALRFASAKVYKRTIHPRCGNYHYSHIGNLKHLRCRNE